jgi:hypothetical protein
MRATYRSLIGLGIILVLATAALVFRHFGLGHSTPALTPSSATVNVVSGADRGPGTLREALFVTDAAPGAATITIQVNRIVLETALPPIVNPHGLRVMGPTAGVEVDAQAVSAGSPVFDVDAEHVSLSGLTISHCPGTAILVRAARFSLTSSTIQGCEVGVEVAANAREVGLERNHFDGNRIGIRFTASSRDAVVAENEFSTNRDASLWLVASQPDSGHDVISVHDNQFSADTTSIVVGNVATVIEHNAFSSAHDAAIHIIGAGAVVRNNRISNGAAAGIVAENARGAVIEANELDHMEGYAILLRGSWDTLVRANRITSCGYGMAFVLGNQQRPSTAVDNAMMDLKYNGIDVIGDSPVLRHNQVAQARVTALHVEDFSPAGGDVVRAQPLLEQNSFQLGSATAAPAAAHR